MKKQKSEKEKYSRTVLRRNLRLETCRQKDHKQGCYIRLSNNEYDYTLDLTDVYADVDTNGRIIGIEFCQGLSPKPYLEQGIAREKQLQLDLKMKKRKQKCQKK